jgi:hypothetical protein
MNPPAFYVDEYLSPNSGDSGLEQRIERALARRAATETPWKVLTVVAVLSGLTGAILGILSLVWFGGAFLLAGDVNGPFHANVLVERFPPGINCSANQVPFHFQTLANGLVVNATCLAPNDTGATLDGGCYGPSDDNFLNVEGTPNQVLIAVNSSRVYKYRTPQDLANTSDVRFNTVSVAVGVTYPLPSPDFTATNEQTSFIAGLDVISYSGFWDNVSNPSRVVEFQATAVGSNSTLIVCLQIPGTIVNFTDTDVITWTSLPTSLAPSSDFGIPAIPVLLLVSTGHQLGIWEFGTPTTQGTVRALSGNITNGAGAIGPFNFCYHK